ncbi:hypothetical protein BDZ91DRAFT_765467 [Kalaharituber pfeilii]|nr:hypothetical protein BDZ91DRAFT_765467 [Kalaharituber pfeilii]
MCDHAGDKEREVDSGACSDWERESKGAWWRGGGEGRGGGELGRDIAEWGHAEEQLRADGGPRACGMQCRSQCRSGGGDAPQAANVWGYNLTPACSSAVAVPAPEHRVGSHCKWAVRQASRGGLRVQRNTEQLSYAGGGWKEVFARMPRSPRWGLFQEHRDELSSLPSLRRAAVQQDAGEEGGGGGGRGVQP